MENAEAHRPRQPLKPRFRWWLTARCSRPTRSPSQDQSPPCTRPAARPPGPPGPPLSRHLALQPPARPRDAVDGADGKRRALPPSTPLALSHRALDTPWRPAAPLHVSTHWILCPLAATAHHHQIPLVTRPLLISNLRTNGSPSPNPPVSMLQQTEPPLIRHRSSPKRCAYNPESMTSLTRPLSWIMLSQSYSHTRPAGIALPHCPFDVGARSRVHSCQCQTRRLLSSALVACSHARLTVTDMPHGVSVDHGPPP
jgi:hypothetical protein